MRTAGLFVLALLTLGALAPPTSAAPTGWHGSLKEGVAAAEKSGKPLLLISAWARTL